MGLTPELSVSDLGRSLAFYTAYGFEILYTRPEEGFAMLCREATCRIMLDQQNLGRSFDPGLTIADQPWGRGMNLEIEVQNINDIVAAATSRRDPIILPLEEKWYEIGLNHEGQRQIVIADPDGYLMRFCQDIGSRYPQSPSVDKQNAWAKTESLSGQTCLDQSANGTEIHLSGVG